MLRRATAFMYRKMVAPPEERGFRDWFDDNCHVFEGAEKGDEQKLEYYQLYQEYEGLVETALVEFCAQEDIESPAALYSMIDTVYEGDATARESKAAGKSIEMLLAAASYKKFVAMMLRRCVLKREGGG